MVDAVLRNQLRLERDSARRRALGLRARGGERQKCGALKLLGSDPCKNWALEGSRFCGVHGKDLH